MRGRPALHALTAVVVAVLIGLGFWQLDRAEQKRALHEFIGRRASELPIALEDQDLDGGRLADWHGRRAVARGTYLSATQVLLDNQVSGGRAGYLVYTPFRLAGHARAVLANRGWLAAGPRRDILPPVAPPGEPSVIRGVIAPPPAGGIKLRRSDELERLEGGLIRVQRLETESLELALGLDLLPFTMVLPPDTDQGLQSMSVNRRSDWTRNQGYAVQWFALAGALVVIHLILSSRGDSGSQP
jgi:surfeit locus 1 family protein